MDPQLFINALSHKDVIDKLCEALGPLIKLTISEITKSITAKFDSTMDAMRQTVDILKSDLIKHDEQVKKLESENSELHNKLKQIQKDLADDKQYSKIDNLIYLIYLQFIMKLLMFQILTVIDMCVLSSS